MQTFLTHTDFDLNARNLDSKRLNKQLLEGRQILSALLTGKGWIHHPATKMWAGSELVLVDYLDGIRIEMLRRNIKTDKNWAAILEFAEFDGVGNARPSWWNSEELGRIVKTHRGSLFNKDPEFYEDFYYESTVAHKYVCCSRCNYYWPTHSQLR